MHTQWFSASGGLVTWFWAATSLCVVGWMALVLFGSLKIGKAGVFSIFGLVLAAWMGLSLTLAEQDVFLDFSLPPKMMLFLLAGLTIAVVATLKTPLRAAVDAVPLGAFVLLQGFRLPLELVMQKAADQGVMPEQMSYSGYNFDIVTGATGLLLGAWMLMDPKGRNGEKLPLALLWGWNLMGSALLLTVFVIALLSFPTPLRVFMNEPPNTWVAMSPFILLPSVMVLCAAWSHLQITRKLLNR